MKLDLRFSDRPLEALWCQAVATLVFQRPDIITEALSGLNKKMTGALANVLEGEILTGDRGENFLLATQNTIRADKLLLHGLGPISEFDTKVLQEEIIELGSTLNKMGVKEFGVHIPVVNGFETEYSSHLELSARNLVKAFHTNHKEDPNFILKIVFSVEKNFMDILDSVVNRLREYFEQILEVSIICR